MFCLKDTLKGQATRFCHSRAGSQNAHLISPLLRGETEGVDFFAPALADSAGMTAEFCDAAMRRQR